MRKVLFFILYILISLSHAQTFATNVHGNTILTRYYFSDCYERDVDSLSNVTQRLYLGGSAYDATMMLEIDSAGSELHYLFRDYLGSVRLVTDRFGDVVQELSYDAWGRLRNPVTHEVYAPGEEPELKIGRGYTSHEHLPWFGLINMNARLYDPVLGRFLSPDPFVQAPDLSQNFNRYAYAMNNPFRYTDESGEFWWLVIGAVIGGATNVIMKAVSGQLHSWGDGFAAFGIGAAAGLVGGAVSGWAFGVAGGAAAGAGGFYAGSLSGAAGSAISAPILSGGNSLYFGDPFMSASEYAYGVLGGALVGGTINGITASVNGKNFFTGKGKNSVEDIIAAYNQNLSHNHQQGVTDYSTLADNELIHYTSKKGYEGIIQSQEIRPSTGNINARYGDGQYLTDLLPSNYTAGQVSRRLYGIPWNTQKIQYYLKIDVTGLNVIQNAPHNFLILNNTPLNINNRIIESGISCFKIKP